LTASAPATSDRRIGRPSYRIVVALWLLVTVLAGLTGQWLKAPLVACGPFAAAVATSAKFPGRQGSVAQVALALAPWGLASLVVGLTSLWVVPSRVGLARVIRPIAWTAGWAGWFACALVSFWHAFGE